ncbi:serine/threonine protein kinase [Paenibacillus sp. PK3_47]|uniref:serine/threonine protein kinase n=1 Tax=Paenibacillus sp. PK3_47 TaxID=2072642 RepID=UPI00201D65B2|nr:serine/threonine-protein kinase [Paenibacillus sp. PK3_47]UQZ37150.1 serine/threonine protein kinase [Paenibacillus sp. PK3_47]
MKFQSKLAAGHILGGRYIITGLIGSGGMGHVYLAEDLRLKGKRWAVKEGMQLEGGYGDLQAEAELLLSLNHRLLPGVADFFAPDEAGYCYLVIDYIDGISLAQYMAGHPEPIEGEKIISYARQLLEVLEYLHGLHPPLIYRDLKPGNVMLTGPDELRLIDFGIARSYRSGSAEDTEKLGTVGFAAPEQYGRGQSGPASDLYGLGALLLYMSSGGRYSSWQPGMENLLRGRIPEALNPVIRRLLRHHPEERYQSAAEVMLALDAAASFKKQEWRGRLEAYPGRSEAVVIALLGTAPGLGTTHTSLAVSHALARKGLTAWIDFSPEAVVYERMRNVLQGVTDSGRFSGGTATRMEWRGIHFWKRPPHGSIPDLPGSLDYAYIVLDLGYGSDPEKLKMFADSELPVLIASGADWRLEETLQWLQRSRLTPQDKWRICLPFAGDSAAALLEEGLGMMNGRVCSLPVQHDPFLSKGKLAVAVKALLADIPRPAVPGKRIGFFQKKS